MGQFNLGTMIIGAPYGANSCGGSRNTSVVSESESFDKTFNRAKTSERMNNDSISTKNTTQDNDSKKSIEAKNNECTYESKKVKNEGDRKVTPKADSEDEKINDSLQVEEDSTTQVIDNQILALVSQVLHLSVDEIKEVLGQLGLEIQDLMSQEGFSTFISEACGQGSIAALLMETDDVKGIATLFEDLNALGEHLQEAMLENASKETLRNELQQEQISEIYNEGTPKIDNKLNDLQAVQVKGDENINVNEEVHLPTVKENVRYNEEAETSDEELSFLQGNEEQTENLGINVPVHHFTTTTFTQSFEAEGTLVTQTTTTKATGSGQEFIKQIDFDVIGQTKELNIQLSPKELGDLNIKIVENNGVLVAEIKVDNEKAKAFILNEIHLLKQNLEEQGLNVADVKVDIRQDNHQSQMEQERQKSSKRIQEIIAKHFVEDDEEVYEDIAPIVSSSEVDYTV